MVFLVKRPDRVDEGFSKSDQRMDELEKTSIKQGRTIALAERSFWSILTGAMGRMDGSHCLQFPKTFVATGWLLSVTETTSNKSAKSGI